MNTPDVPGERLLNDILQVIDENPCGCGYPQAHGHLSENRAVTREEILAALDRLAARRAADYLDR